MELSDDGLITLMKYNTDYSLFYDWEFDLICTRQKEDIKLWKNLAARYGDPILEVCCGSGRITRELAEMGFEITALDNSVSMLKILSDKNLKKVNPVLADMRDFDLNKKFKFIFIGYSSFQQLLTTEDQMKCLRTIRKHLAEDGILGVDINPHILEEPETVSPEIAYIADYPPNNSRITMFTSHYTDRDKRIRHWNDRYLEIDKDGNKHEFWNNDSLRECTPDDIKTLFANCGFRIRDVFGDFEGGELKQDSWNNIWLASCSSI